MMDALLKDVLTSLKQDPDEWIFDDYNATNERTGVCIWIANKSYGLNVRFPGGYKLPEHDDVSAAPCLFGSLTWRGSLLRQCNQIRRDRWLKEREVLRSAAAAAL